MATAAPARLLTAEEFYELEESAHGGKMELIRGEVVIHMPVGGPHGSIFSAKVRAMCDVDHT